MKDFIIPLVDPLYRDSHVALSVPGALPPVTLSDQYVTHTISCSQYQMTPLALLRVRMDTGEILHLTNVHRVMKHVRHALQMRPSTDYHVLMELSP